MSFDSINDLPDTIQDTLPAEAQEIYLKTYNKAWENYAEEEEPGEQSREAVAHRDAWTAVKKEFVFIESKERWYRKGEEPQGDEDEEQGLVDKIKDAL